MKLYFYDYIDGEIKMRCEEWEEKPKTYLRTGKIYRAQIKKKQIGRVKAHYAANLILTEDNIEKAKEIFIKDKKEEIMSRKKTIEYEQEKIMELEEEIRKLE